LLNRYDVILFDPKEDPEVQQQPARRLADWQQLYHPSADQPK
jgi:ABC-type tungstate transport system permease subunit